MREGVRRERNGESGKILGSKWEINENQLVGGLEHDFVIFYLIIWNNHPN